MKHVRPVVWEILTLVVVLGLFLVAFSLAFPTTGG